MKEISDLQIGKAGEYIVCADLILKGYAAFLADKGSRFDAVLEYNGRLFKIQIKSTRGHRLLSKSEVCMPVFLFNVGVNGKYNKRKQYDAVDVDIFALVDLETRTVAYLPHSEALKVMHIRVPALRGTYADEESRIWREKVIELKKQGKKRSEIIQETGLGISQIYWYLNRPDKSKIMPYLDEYTFEICMNKLNNL